MNGNNWSEQEKLIQLAGHLRGKAQREWDLMAENSKASFGAAVKALRARLDSGSRAVAAQDFRHLSQKMTESVADFICRLEKTFRRAYGHEQMSEETRSTLLYGQLNEGLKYSLIKAPAVSGASEYQQLCVAARNEERRQSELVKRQQYQQADHRLGRQDRLDLQVMTTRTRQRTHLIVAEVQVIRGIKSSAGTVRRQAIRQKIVDFQSGKAPETQGLPLVPRWYRVMQRMIH